MDKRVTTDKIFLLTLEPIRLLINSYEINYKNQRHKTTTILFQILGGLESWTHRIFGFEGA